MNAKEIKNIDLFIFFTKNLRFLYPFLSYCDRNKSVYLSYQILPINSMQTGNLLLPL